MYAYPRTFRCPNCNEMINDAMANCNYCGVAIDPGIAALVAERQAQANQAYSDASYLRNTAAAMFVFLLVGLVFTIGYIGSDHSRSRRADFAFGLTTHAML